MVAAARDGARLARGALRRARLHAPMPAAPRVAPRRASSSSSPAAAHGSAPASQAADLADLESTATFSSPAPDQGVAAAFDAFNAARRSGPRERELPGSRYQYHPPKFYRGPLHPVQVPPSSDPVARDFVPGPFSYPRLKHTYESTIAADLMTLTYAHVPAGSSPPESSKGVLREWDDSSPYHMNRPRRGPRGSRSSRLGLLERDIAWNNIPEVQAVTVNSFAPLASGNKEYLQVARAVVQAITGHFPAVTKIKHNVSQWGVRKGDRTGAVVTMRGAAAYDFVDKLVTLVLPKIRDWRGIKGSSGDSAGNLTLGLEPEWMAYFPEMEFNYDMYPSQLIPGCHIFIHTSATSDRQARLLLQALGFPFHGKMVP